jgi:hypothetical protein
MFINIYGINKSEDRGIGVPIPSNAIKEQSA